MVIRLVAHSDLLIPDFLSPNIVEIGKDIGYTVAGAIKKEGLYG